MRVSVFGIGYVGVVSCGCLAELGHEVIGVDIAKDKLALLRAGRSPVVENRADALIAGAVKEGRLTVTDDVDIAISKTDVSFIAVGTPSAANGSTSLAAVDRVTEAIGRAIRGKNTSHTVIMRSTVPPGTGEDRVIPMLEFASRRRHGDGLAYYSNPEFLREGTAVQDFFAPPFTLIGAPPGDDAHVVRELYAPIQKPVHVAPYRTVESVKYVSNVYHAVKLAFANEAGAVLAANGVDARSVFSLFAEDHVLNISAAYLRPGFAFGGSCLPKDVRSFLALGSTKAIQTPFIGSILPSNHEVIERTFAATQRLGRRPVTLFGLAFKEGTDDLRESPLVTLAERLIGKGYDLRIFDRSLDMARLNGSNRAYIDREIPHLERLMISDAREAAERSEIAIIGHIAKPDLPLLRQGLASQTIIDLAGVAELRTLPGIEYQGLCW